MSNLENNTIVADSHEGDGDTEEEVLVDEDQRVNSSKGPETKTAYGGREIPYLIAAADLLQGLAEGAMQSFFPIFFTTNLNLSPILVQVVYVSSCFGQAIASHILQGVAKRAGRLHLAFAMRITSSILLVSLMLSDRYNGPPVVTILLFLLRTYALKPTEPLTNGVLI